MIRKFLKRYRAGDFVAWLWSKYLDDRLLRLEPRMFREYGEGVTIDRGVSINRPDRVVLKEQVVIHQGVLINSLGGLWVGRNSVIGYNSTIFTVAHRYVGASTIPFDRTAELRPVIIREFVWMGAGAMILPGVEIGEGAILGMGTVVARNIPPLALVFGNPAEIIGYRDRAHYERCKSEGFHQNPRVDVYDETVTRIYRVRYRRELEELGLAQSP